MYGSHTSICLSTSDGVGSSGSLGTFSRFELSILIDAPCGARLIILTHVVQHMSNAVDVEYARKKARDRYWTENNRKEYSCEDCGRGEEELLENFEVHHIDGDPTNNEMDNLVGLCQPCHNIREGKKPSLRKTQHALSQLSHRSNESFKSSVVVCETEEAYGDYVNKCFQIKRPPLLVDKRFARKWFPVEVDMLAMEGAFKLTTGDEEIELGVRLSKNAAGTVNTILDSYSDVETGGTHSQRLLQFPEEPNGGFHSFPGMKLEVAKKLASDLQIVFENPMNWVPENAYHIKNHMEEYGFAKIEMEPLGWLPAKKIRNPWKIKEGHFEEMCNLCGDNPIPEVEPPERPSDHCQECQDKLAWKYSDCEHENTKSVRDPDSGDFLQVCRSCSMEKSNAGF